MGCNLSPGAEFSGPRLLLYIDGVIKGQSQGPTDGAASCSSAQGWTSAHTSAVGSYAFRAPYEQAGEPVADWNTSLESDLSLWYGDVAWPDCAGHEGSHILWGNWSSPGIRTSACCTSCPDHQVSVGDNRTSNSSCVCNAGYTGPTQGHCDACAMGKFKAAIGSSDCSSCAYGEYTLSAGSAACVSPTCKPCPANAISAQASVGLADCFCKAGHYGNASMGAACSTCPPDSSSPAAAVALEACVCNQGFYGHPSQSQDCHACPPNSAPLASVANARYIQDCSCNAGYYGRPTPYSSPACQRCPVDTYQPQLGAHNLTDCQGCPNNSSTLGRDGAAARGSCLCHEGFFGDLGGGAGNECAQCPRHTFGPKPGALSQSFCRFCPENAAALDMAATNITDCRCNAGFSGAVGVSSLAGQADVCMLDG